MDQQSRNDSVQEFSLEQNSHTINRTGSFDTNRQLHSNYASTNIE
jgi:hypothetical protein